MTSAVNVEPENREPLNQQGLERGSLSFNIGFENYLVEPDTLDERHDAFICETPNRVRSYRKQSRSQIVVVIVVVLFN